MTTSFTLDDQELQTLNAYGNLITQKEIELTALRFTQEQAFKQFCTAHGASQDAEYDVNFRSGLVTKKEEPKKEEPKEAPQKKEARKKK